MGSKKHLAADFTIPAKQVIPRMLSNSIGGVRVRIFESENKKEYVVICSAMAKSISPTNHIESIFGIIKRDFFIDKTRKPHKNKENTNKTNSPDLDGIGSLAATVTYSFLSNDYRPIIGKINESIKNKKYISRFMASLKNEKQNTKKQEEEEDDDIHIKWYEHYPKTMLRASERHLIGRNYTLDRVEWEDKPTKWYSITDSEFIKQTGIDVRRINDLEIER